MTSSSYRFGGLEPRFIIERADGQPIPKDRRYCLVLDFSGRDPHAIIAARACAESVEPENFQLARPPAPYRAACEPTAAVDGVA